MCLYFFQRFRVRGQLADYGNLDIHHRDSLEYSRMLTFCICAESCADMFKKPGHASHAEPEDWSVLSGFFCLGLVEFRIDKAKELKGLRCG